MGVIMSRDLAHLIGVNFLEEHYNFIKTDSMKNAESFQQCPARLPYSEEQILQFRKPKFKAFWPFQFAIWNLENDELSNKKLLTLYQVN